MSNSAAIVELHNPQSYAEQSLNFTIAMRQCAEQKDWEQLTVLEQRRALVMEKLFQHPDITLELGKIAGLLRRIIEMDQETIALGKEVQQVLKSEMKLLRQGKRAVDAYLDSSATGF
ncbi:MAG: flagellar protein FliT [Gammaproteobacteria bacterium]|nr:flagellar protein FliT [Gammaproteobacteria bacterium]MDH5652948.1 flagellar protein FliT [Gammaproteobacteria bacterium]